MTTLGSLAHTGLPYFTGSGTYDILPDEFYTPFLSDAAKSRKPAPIRSLIPMETQPGMLSLLAGKPNPLTYPFERISISLKPPASAGLCSPPVETIELAGEDLTSALQYNQTSGIPALVAWVTSFMQHEHQFAEDGGRAMVSIGSGSQDLLYKALSALINPGDVVLVEAPTYPGILPIFDSLGCEVLEIESDSEGIEAEKLAKVLQTCKKKPKALYTVPYGANPTGMTTTLSRRISILALARRFDFLILEDDPYYHLYYGNRISINAATDEKPASYLALERRISGPIGRVLRFDSLSKILAAGFRLGWATGPAVLIQCIERHSATSTMQPPSISQMLVLKLFEKWGISGFLAHTQSVANFYMGKRDVFERYLIKHLVNGTRLPMAQWNTPNAAMFYWIKLNLPHHTDSNSFIEGNAMQSGVLMLPGACGYIEDARGRGRKTCYVRMSFSLLEESEVDEVLRRLKEALRDEWKKALVVAHM